MNHGAETEKLIVDGAEQNLSRQIIEFDPLPTRYLFAVAPDDAEVKAMDQAVLQPDPIPWPPDQAPTRPVTPPADVDLLPAADVLVMTYTVAEGYAPADVLTSGRGTTDWTPYRSGWNTLKPTIAHGAPSLSRNQAGL